MAKLTLRFRWGKRDVRLRSTLFAHGRLPREIYAGGELGAAVGRRQCQWRPGLQALLVFLLRCRLSASRSAASEEAPWPPFSGRRPSLAATVNDLVTRPSNTVNKIFGQIRGFPMFPELIRRDNPDFNTQRDGEVTIWLKQDELDPAEIDVTVDDQPVDDPRELERLIANLSEQWARAGRRTRPLSQGRDARGTLAGAAATPTPTAGEPDSWWELFPGVEAGKTFSEIDQAWGRAALRLLASGAMPDGERQDCDRAAKGRWSLLAECHGDIRRGRWSQVIGKLRSPVTACRATSLMVPADAVWFGRAANLLVLAAIRTNEEGTVAECLEGVERVCDHFTASDALRAQMLHYRARFRWRRRYQELHLAGRDLVAAYRLYESLPPDSPWREAGLAQVSDSLGEYYADVGDAASAEQSFRESILRKGRLGDRYGEALSHGRLGRLFFEIHDLARAQQELLVDLQLSRQALDERGESVARNNLAEVFLLAAEAGGAGSREQLDEAISHLEESRHICQRIGNRVGEGLALVGTARATLAPAEVSHNDLRRAIALAEEGSQLLASCTRRPEWRRYAQLWLGWGYAKQAASTQELADVDSRYFLAAVEDLREAGLKLDLSEALFQRARMLTSEGRRLDAAVQEQAIESLCQAVEHSRLLKVPSLARRYLCLARDLDAEAWVQVLSTHRRSLDALAHEGRRWRALGEERCQVLSLALAEIGQALQPLTTASNSSAEHEPPKIPLESIRQTTQRLRRIERVLDLLRQPLDFAGRLVPAELAQRLEDCRVQTLVERGCGLAQAADAPRPSPPVLRGGSGGCFTSHAPTITNSNWIKFDVDSTLHWETFPELMELIVESLVRCAAALAVGGKDPTANRPTWVGLSETDKRSARVTDPAETPDRGSPPAFFDGPTAATPARILVRGSLADCQLRIDVLVAGERGDQRTSERELRGGPVVSEASLLPVCRDLDLGLATYFARRLNGDVHWVPQPAPGVAAQLRACFEPLRKVGAGT